MNKLVSIIVSTRNNAQFLEQCLHSIKRQTYKQLEIIVVDNHSSDDTVNIARQFTSHVFQCGPERSAQRNYGVAKANGDYIYIVDADFELHRDIISECVSTIQKGFDAVIVHNTPDSRVGLLAKVRKFEVDMYKYDLTHSAARFFKKSVFKKLNGYNEKLVAGEDYDIQNRLNKNDYKTSFIDSEATHLDESKSFWKLMQKYYQYGRKLVDYQAENIAESRSQLAFFRPIYFKNWRKFLRHPILGFLFVWYNCFKYLFGGLGYTVRKLSSRQ